MSERMPTPNSPMAVARIIAGEHHHRGADGEHLTLRHWRGAWMEWAGSHWVEAETAATRAALYKRLESCHYLDKDGKATGWLPTKPKVTNLLEALSAVVHLPERHNPPGWITPHNGDLPGTHIACANGLLEVAGRTLRPLTPRYFNTIAVPFDYKPDAPTPARWLAFLDQLWPGDPESVAALQEWFGYVLSGRTDLQKMLMLIGPTRSGKGTIARILAQLTGDVAGPTLRSLGEDFGLASLLGKPLAIISDARLGRGQRDQVIVERLLSISGEDILDVNRKYREPWTGKIGARLMLLSNELPQFGDDSGAISGRFVVLSMTRSFLGEENPRLLADLTAEMPGILEWALDGLTRLTERDSFATPESSADAVRVMRDLVSPISAFVRERCEIGAFTTAIDDVWAEWKEWAEDNGLSKSTKQVLGRSLRSTVPSVRTTQPRNGATRFRAFEGIRLRERNGTEWNAIQTKTYTYGDGALEDPALDIEEVYESVPHHRVPPQVCGTCDEAGDHLPGCPARGGESA